MAKKGKGWFYEYPEHSLAARGIRSKVKLPKIKKIGYAKFSTYSAAEAKKYNFEQQKYSQEKADELVIKKAIAKEFEDVTGRKMAGVEERSLAEMRSVLKYVKDDAEKVAEKEKGEKKLNLSGFTGTENYHKDYLGINLTDGMAYVRDEGEAGWLISDIASVVRAEPKVKKTEFVTIKFDVKDKQGKISYQDGNGNKLYGQQYKYTDFPTGNYTFYFANNVLMLPSEY